MMINVFFPFKGVFYIFALMVFAMARYCNLSDKEIKKLIEENERMDAEIKHLADPLLYPKNFQGYSIPSEPINHLHWGKLTNNSKRTRASKFR